MSEKRVQFQNIVENQLPTYVQTEFPLVSEFLKSYYVSQEFQGAPVDLIQNIDDYTKIDSLTNDDFYKAGLWYGAGFIQNGGIYTFNRL